MDSECMRAIGAVALENMVLAQCAIFYLLSAMSYKCPIQDYRCQLSKQLLNILRLFATQLHKSSTNESFGSWHVFMRVLRSRTLI
jgi:hypothetical protein